MSKAVLQHQEDVAQVKEVHLSYDVYDVLKKRLSSLDCKSDVDWLEARDWISAQIKHVLPESIINELENFSRNTQRSALIIRGCPVDSALPPTPYHGYLEPDCLPLATAIHIGIYHLAGLEPVAYQNENDGKLFRHVVPANYALNQKSSHGSRKTFGMHVDNPDLPLTPEPIIDRSGSPEFLSLMAIRTDLRVKSSIALLDSVLDKLDQNTIRQLSQHNFLVSRPDSFDNSKSSKLPLLITDEGNIHYCRFDKENVSPTTPEAAAALLMLRSELEKEENRIQVAYQPGDLLIIKNQRLFHSREGFMPRDDGTDRWLIRLFGMSSSSRIAPISEITSHIGFD
ncbi:TauD/TfdA family dioxygenase [Parendozoicomonas sp. Alg238-R29]|uniref:TauD/TfdA family dioxygenase n=1 Tax=Parendozoicomonas sp. Alg238-R29 TaxID=2993446 RepID=UPI00248F2261|nr:TauD/TfdA family dioxygenase [Parendozoicomonas sp. Alg238-R29]